MNTNNENSIGIHFIGLNQSERATFDRVIAFNATHGLTTHHCEDVNTSDLIICTESAIPSTQKVVIVIGNDTSKGNFQVSSPLLITRVMKAFQNALDDVKNNQQQESTIDHEPEDTNLTPISEDFDQDNSPEVKENITSIDDEKIESQIDTEVTNTALNADTPSEEDVSDPISEELQSPALSIVENNIEISSESEKNSQTDDNIINIKPEIPPEEIPTAEIVDITQEVENDSQDTGHHALVIDDSAAIRKQLELELRDAGITADFAECGEDALDKIKDTQYDLIFLDIMMPGIDGYDTCKAMRKTEAYKKTPIIMLSGKTSPLDEVQGVIAGATTYLTKPVKSAMLQETLNRVTKWIENYAKSKDKENSVTV